MEGMIYWPVWRLALAMILAVVWGGFAWQMILWIKEIIQDRREDEALEDEHDSCDGCRWDLGGGCCSLNVEDECAAGGGYELWEGDDDV